MASLMGISLEVDKNNMRRWEYVRVKIRCRDVSKAPAIVEWLLDLHFFYFNFQREVVMGGQLQLGTPGQEMLTSQMKTTLLPKKQGKGKENTINKEALTGQLDKKTLLDSSMVDTKKKVV